MASLRFLISTRNGHEKTLQPGEIDDDGIFGDIVCSKPPVPPGHAPQIETSFKLCIVIDFGTDGIGLAYAYNGKIYVHSKWKSVRFASTNKPKTIILLDDDGDVNSFGMDAKYTLIIHIHHDHNQK